MKITFKKASELRLLSEKYIARHPDTKLAYAMKKVFKDSINEHEDTLKEQIEDLRIDNCLTDEKTGAILRDEKGKLQLTKEGEKSFNRQANELVKKFGEGEIEVTPFIVKEIPELSQEEIEAFTGIFI